MSAVAKGEILSPRDIPEELIERYSRQGPRYTSYPTAPQFHTEYLYEDMLARWRESDRDKGLSFYVHIPFCARRCLYCGCHTRIGAQSGEVSSYVDSLLDEMRLAARLLERRGPVMQMAFGGGTPSHLPPEDMRRLLVGMSDIWSFAQNAERSIELDPRTVDLAYLDLLLELGFNRFSFGVQDLNPEVMKYVGRVQEDLHIHAMLEHLRNSGHHAINLDLIYGLPGQNMESFDETLSHIVEMNPSRLALFGYAHVPWLHPHQKALEKHGLPGPHERTALFDLGFRLLREAGYEHVGMDHFAKPEDELVQALRQGKLHRNFMGYTTRRGLDLVAFGASGISAVNGTYVQDRKKLSEYAQSVQEGHMPWERGYIMSRDDVVRRELIIELFCNFRLDTKAFGKHYEIEFANYFKDELSDLLPFIKDGLVELSDEVITVTQVGRFFIRNVCMLFDAYLEQTGSKARYSQTV